MDEQRMRVLLRRPNEDGFLARRDLPDGRYLTLQPNGANVKLTISRAGDEYGHYDSY